MSQTKLILTLLLVLFLLTSLSNDETPFSRSIPPMAIADDADPLILEVYPAKEIFSVGEEVLLSLYMNKGIEEGLVTLKGPSGTIRDELGRFPEEGSEGEVFASYFVGVAEERDIGTWHVTFRGCVHISMSNDQNGDQKYCDSTTATFEVVERPLPDLKINIKTDRSSLSIDETVKIDVSLMNQGIGDAYNAKVSYSSDFFVLTGGPPSWTYESIAAGASTDSKTLTLKAVGPTGDGTLTFTTEYFDDTGKEYQKEETLTINIQLGIALQVTSLYDTADFADYYSRILKSPYPLHNTIEITITGGGVVKNALLRVTGLPETTIPLEDMGNGRFTAQIQPFDKYTPNEVRDLTRLILTRMAGHRGVALPSPSWVYTEPRLPSVILEEIVITFTDGTEIQRDITTSLPTVIDALQANLQTWTTDRTIIVAMAQEDVPVDLLLTDPTGLRIGASIEDGATSVIKEVANAFYSGTKSNPQFIYLPFSAGDHIIQAHGKREGAWDLYVFTLGEQFGHVKELRTIPKREGETLMLKVTLSESGVVEELERRSWLQLDETWPLLLIIPVVAVVIVAILFVRRRRPPAAPVWRPQGEPPPTLPEEVPEG